MHFLSLVISIWLLTISVDSYSNALRSRGRCSPIRLGALKPLKASGGGNRVLPYDKIVKQLKFNAPNFDSSLAEMLVDTGEKAIKEWR